MINRLAARGMVRIFDDGVICFNILVIGQVERIWMIEERVVDGGDAHALSRGDVGHEKALERGRLEEEEWSTSGHARWSARV